jgi:hypothetical protein
MPIMLENLSPCSLYITDGNTRFVFNNNLHLSQYTRNIIGVITFNTKRCFSNEEEDHSKIEEDLNLQELKKMLGLRCCFDSELETYYLNPDNCKQLRYDRIVKTTDNQSIINLVTEYYPSLYKQNFIVHYRHLNHVHL